MRPAAIAKICRSGSFGIGAIHATVSGKGTIEAHVLRNRNTLIFVSQPFENAKRINPLAAANSE